MFDPQLYSINYNFIIFYKSIQYSSSSLSALKSTSPKTNDASAPWSLELSVVSRHIHCKKDKTEHLNSIEFDSKYFLLRIFYLITMTSYGIETSKLKAAREKLPPIKLSSFIDPTQPWVLVPNGSLLGFFDWVGTIHVIGCLVRKI